jgi:hypothetical protein
MSDLAIDTVKKNIELTGISTTGKYTLKTVFSNASIFVLSVLMICSMNPWFVWYNGALYRLSLSLLFLCLRFCLLNSSKITFSKLIIIFFCVLLFSEQILPHFKLTSAISAIRQILTISFVLIMHNEEKRKIIRLTTTIYAWIVGISLVFYIFIVFCGFQFPYTVIKYPNIVTTYPDFRNYIFLINSNGYNIFDRFRSVFTEPGHLGMISALMLYANSYRLKKKSVFIVFISALMSFSLAAYVLLIIGYFIYEFINGKKIYAKLAKIILVITLLAGSGIYIYTKYSDSLISQLIISRLEYDEDKGIAGNNRNSLFFDNYYEKEFYKDASIYIFGVGDDYFMKNLAGKTSSYKVFIVKYGLTGIVLLFIFYLSIVYESKSKLLFGLFVLYCASFWQRPYALWEIELFLFIGAAGRFHVKTCRSISENEQ